MELTSLTSYPPMKISKLIFRATFTWDMLVSGRLVHRHQNTLMQRPYLSRGGRLT